MREKKEQKQSGLLGVADVAIAHHMFSTLFHLNLSQEEINYVVYIARRIEGWLQRLSKQWQGRRGERDEIAVGVRSASIGGLFIGDGARRS